jgi:hypothetical protein
MSQFKMHFFFMASLVLLSGCTSERKKQAHFEKEMPILIKEYKSKARI